MIQIRPGRSWRHNPTYASELARLGDAEVRAFDGARILDVLGIEIDGVDIAAGVGEAPLCTMVDELVQAALQLGRGEPAAQATVGPGPVQMVLERRGQDVLLTLLSLRAPSRVLAGGLLVDAMRLRAAALGAAQRVLADLLDLGPALRSSPWVRRITRDLRELARSRTTAAETWPPEGQKIPGFVARSIRAEVRLEVRVPAASAARLAARASAPNSTLAPLLGPGSLALRFAGAPTVSLSIDAAPYLALREILRSAEELVRAFESGEPSFLLRLGNLELQCDLTRDELRAEGVRAPIHAPPLALAQACATAARAFARRALALGDDEKTARPQNLTRKIGDKNFDKKLVSKIDKNFDKKKASQAARDQDGPLATLGEQAAALLAHCRDLASGDLQRAPQAVRAPPIPLPAPSTAPAALRSNLRRLVHRLAFELEAGPIADSGLHVFPAAGSAVLQGAAGLFAIDLQSSARLWHLAGAAPTHAQLARTSSEDLFALHEGALLRLDPATGEARFRRAVRGAGARIFSVAGGCAVSLASGGIALVRDNGTLAFRANTSSEEAIGALAADGVLLVQLAGGQLVGLDSHDGTELWRRRIGLRAGQVIRSNKSALATTSDARGASRIISVAISSGETLWERALPPSENSEPGPLTLFGESCATLAGRGLFACRLHDGAPAFSRELPWRANIRLHAVELNLNGANQREHALVALGPGAAALQLDERGEQRWSRPALSPESVPPLKLDQQGQTLLLASSAVELIEASSGRTLTRAAMADVDHADLLPDLSVLMHLRDGTLASLKLATHLSLV